MMIAAFNGNPSTALTFCYSPTNAREETNLNNFYNVQSSLARIIPKHNVQISVET